MTDSGSRSGYATVNGLRMYHEIRGEGEPIVLLHGAYMTADAMGDIIPQLAEERKVIAVELQGHERTADVQGRPLTYEQMADDVAALVEQLEIGNSDVLGFSMGGGVALQVAIRHPEVVRKLVLISVSYTHEGMHPELLASFPDITPEMFAGSPIEEEYRRLAPDPDALPTLVEKLKVLDTTPFAWPEEDVRSIGAPVFLVVGDSDAIRLEHAVEFFGLLGGGVMGDLSGLPKSRFAVLPATTHFMPPGSGVMEKTGWLGPMIEDFLAAPMEDVS